MVGRYLRVNDREYPNPTDMTENYDNLETVNESEAGTDLIVEKRLGKLTANMTFQVSRLWRDRIITDCNLTSSIVYIDGVRKTGRLRLIDSHLEPESVNTDGYYTMTVVFYEK